MIGTKESELTTAVRLYAIRCSTEGDVAALRRMQIGDKEINTICDMRMDDILQLGQVMTHCVNITLNKEVYWSLMEHVRRQRTALSTMEQLIREDAPFEMIQAFYGLPSREYTARRKQLSVPNSVGRPKEPSEFHSHQLWYAWKDLEKDEQTLRIKPEEYLHLHSETEIPLRSIWLLTERWIETGFVNES